jgi:hypothetical protein
MANRWCFRRLGWYASSVLGLSLLLATVQRAVAAPAFGEAGRFALTAEDVTGYSFRSLKYWDRNDRTVEYSRSAFSFALASGGVRLGLHYFVIPGLSLGGTVGYESVSGSNTYQDNPGTWSTDVPTNNHFVLAPKVGYVLMFTDVVGFWFRAGLGYERFKLRASEGDSRDYYRESFLMASADILFVCSPIPHFGLFVGPTGDRSLVGSHFVRDVTNGDYSNDSRFWRLGLTSGLIGYF